MDWDDEAILRCAGEKRDHLLISRYLQKWTSIVGPFTDDIGEDRVGGHRRAEFFDLDTSGFPAYQRVALKDENRGSRGDPAGLIKQDADDFFPVLCTGKFLFYLQQLGFR